MKQVVVFHRTHKKGCLFNDTLEYKINCKLSTWMLVCTVKSFIVLARGGLTFSSGWLLSALLTSI